LSDDPKKKKQKVYESKIILKLLSIILYFWLPSWNLVIEIWQLFFFILFGSLVIENSKKNNQKVLAFLF
jgi:hypothetical protein